MKFNKFYKEVCSRDENRLTVNVSIDYPEWVIRTDSLGKIELGSGTYIAVNTDEVESIILSALRGAASEGFLYEEKDIIKFKIDGQIITKEEGSHLIYSKENPGVSCKIRIQFLTSHAETSFENGGVYFDNISVDVDCSFITDEIVTNKTRNSSKKSKKVAGLGAAVTAVSLGVIKRRGRPKRKEVL